MSNGWKRAVATTLALGLAASGGGARVASAPTPVAPVTADDLTQANTALLAGDTGKARKLIRELLKRDPMNASAQLLRDAMQQDAREQLGPQSYAYTVRAGDTIVTLAQRLLGNRLKAYQLGRYNELSAPFALTVGQTLRIPGEPPHAEPVRRPPPPPARPASSAASASTPNAPPVATPAPRTATPAANPVLARQLRTAGLAALNGGNVNRALGLLRRAASLDPGNPMIANDLARAVRIARTVQARR
jgi:tetratricopeptide (TPR) repeat protein